MHYYEVAPTKIIRAGSDVFTYSSHQVLPIGQIVTIEVGTSTHIGVVIRETVEPSYATKDIASTIETPVPLPLIELALWMSSYYATPLAQVLQSMLPAGLLKKRRETTQSNRENLRERTNFLLTSEQSESVQKISSAKPGTYLLQGVTGSGKTTVYIELAKQQIKQHKSVIVLVPEIALTSQIVDEFTHHFDNVIVTHSKQTEADRHKQWLAALSATQPCVIIGPRSALFMPLAQLGLIIIDECHEPSFQQEQSPRYSALRVASQYAHLLQAKAVFGSATPLVSDYYLASKHSEASIIHMTKPAREAATKPHITLIDMTKRSNFKQHRFISDQLIARIEDSLARKEQVLIFHNRRGSASTTLCEHCGWQAGCPRCYVPLTLHADTHQLRCHICGLTAKVPTHCPQCQHVDIVHKGIGTKLIEAELQKLFKKATIARFDGDSATENTVEARYKELYDGDINIIIGTQVVAKGLDLPHLRTVGVIQADAGLSLPDYSSSERTFQLLAQVVGRVGRSSHATEVIIQSYQPTHPVVVHGIAQQYEEFYTRTIELRRHTNFPPFSFLLKLTCIYKTEATTIKHAKALADILRQHMSPKTELLGPTPSFYERQRDTYRWQITLKSKNRAELLQLLAHVPKTHWQFELDPISLL